MIAKAKCRDSRFIKEMKSTGLEDGFVVSEKKSALLGS